MKIEEGSKIFLTGSSGVIGSRIARHLHGRGFRLICFDRNEPRDAIDGAEYHIGDINDYNHLAELMAGADAVVHMAAIPNPSRGSSREIMRINVLGSFNVFSAAVQNGAKKIVQASSINALGSPYGVKRLQTKYFPIDEEHPSLLSDPYSLSKKFCEDMADYFWNRDSMHSVSLRFPAVFDLADKSRWDKYDERVFLDALEDMESLDRQARIEKILSIYDDDLKSSFKLQLHNPESRKDPEKRHELKKKFIILKVMRDFLAYLDFSDCVSAVRLALTSDISGSVKIFLTGPDNGKGVETTRIINVFFPEVFDSRENIHSDMPLISLKKAREAIGFQPTVSIRRYSE